MPSSPAPSTVTELSRTLGLPPEAVRATFAEAARRAAATPPVRGRRTLADQRRRRTILGW